MEAEVSISSRPHLNRLLDEFVTGGGEQSFRPVVEHLQPFIFSIALRRTGNREMAEDVTQTVFISIARMAPQLRKHTRLMVWVSQATHFSSLKAIRSEQRKQRKHAALAADPGRSSEGWDDGRWDEVAPHLDASLGALPRTDHEMILLRFYEGRKFAEIADRLGSTEAACKMRMKRALDKLARLLSAKGVAVPLVALTAGLSTELAKAAPAAGSMKIAAGALAPGAAAGGLFTTGIMGIMTTSKTIPVAAIVLLTAAGLPLALQASRLGKAEAELAGLESRLEALATPGRQPRPERINPAPATVRDLIGVKANEDTRAILTRLLEAAMEGDQAALLRARAYLGGLDAGRYSALLAEAKEFPGSDDARRLLMNVLAELAPPDARAGEIDKLVSDNQAPAAGKLLQGWAEQDPEAAIRWFLENKAAGNLVGTAVSDRTETNLLANLLSGLVRKDAARAVALYAELGAAPADGWDNAASALAKGFGELLAEGKAAAEFQTLLATTADPLLRQRLIDEAARHAAPRGDLDANARFISSYVAGPERDEMVLFRIVGSGDSFDKQLANARRLLNDMKQAKAVDAIVSVHGEGDIEEVRKWLGGLPAGDERDEGHRAICRMFSYRSQFTEAFAAANLIRNPAERTAAIRSFAMEWMENDEAGARAALPADVIQSLPPR
jgi:RNA polymerase sigma factor (sigma-70 family)